MANVAFKQGLQTALNSIAQNKTGQAGSFYLTSDSHSLYIGLADGSIAAVNEGVTTVANVAALPVVTSGKDLTAGQFYYAATENILLAATELGLGSLWCGIHPQKHAEKRIADILGLTNKQIPLNIVYIGHPAEEPEPRDQYKEKNVHWI